MQAIYTSLQTDNHTSTSLLNFYTLNALPDAQPVSKHQRQIQEEYNGASSKPAHNPKMVVRSANYIPGSGRTLSYSG